MRSVVVKINGAEYCMPCSFAVSQAIAERVADPLKLAIEAHQTGMMPLSSMQIVTVIAIGAKAAGCALTEKEIGEAIFDQGLIDHVQIAANYISAIVSGGPEKPIPAGKKTRK